MMLILIIIITMMMVRVVVIYLDHYISQPHSRNRCQHWDWYYTYLQDMVNTPCTLLVMIMMTMIIMTVKLKIIEDDQDDNLNWQSIQACMVDIHQHHHWSRYQQGSIDIVLAGRVLQLLLRYYWYTYQACIQQ